MHEWQNLSHVRWDCKDHVVIVPKYRRKVFYGRLRRQIGVILRELCRQRGIELVEGHAMPDHVHLGLSIPPNVFGPGLGIAHDGSIVVNSRARVGAWCRINSATNIGMTRSGVPTLGDFVYIAPGAVVYGGITVGDRVVIGANAVVGRDVEAGVTVAGSPARVINRQDSSSVMPDFVPTPASVAAARRGGTGATP